MCAWRCSPAHQADMTSTSARKKAASCDASTCALPLTASRLILIATFSPVARTVAACTCA